MDNKRDYALPLGSVVKLKNDESYMIMGYNVIEKETNKTYDYIGCDSNYGISYKVKLINEEDIKKIDFYGFETPTLIKANEIIRKEEEK